MAHADAGALREQLSAVQQQAASLQSDLDTARQEAAAAAQRAADLEQRLLRQQAAAQAAAESGAATLLARLGAAQQAQQQFASQAEELRGQLAAAGRQVEESRKAAAVVEAESRQLHQRLAASEQQRSEALEAVEQQSAALEGLQAALDRLQMQEGRAAEASAAQQQLARQLAATQQQLATAQQAAAVAQKQAEVLRAQAGRAEAEAARAAAEKRHLASREAAVGEALQRYQRGVAVLSSTLQQLQTACAGREAGEDGLLASLQAGASAGVAAAGGSGMAVEHLVDEILLQASSFPFCAAIGTPLVQRPFLLQSCHEAQPHGCRCCWVPTSAKQTPAFSTPAAPDHHHDTTHPLSPQVHRRDCEISSLVAQLAHLEAALATKGRLTAEAEVRGETLHAATQHPLPFLPAGPSCSLRAAPALMQAKQQQSQQSLGRLREQLHWSGKESEALKRQLSERDSQLHALGRRGPLRATAPSSSAGVTPWQRLTLAGASETATGPHIQS